MSTTFYEKLLREQIPKAQKKTDTLTLYFVPLGSARVKASRKMLVKLTSDVILTDLYEQILN